MSRSVRIAGVQVRATPDTEDNLRRAEGLLRIASGEGAKMVAFPQLFNRMWFPANIDKRNFSLAEEESGRSVTFLRELAAREGVYVIASIFEKDGGDHFNTAFVIGSDGSIAGRYRKIHVPQIPLWEERSYFKPGNLGFPVFETPYGNVGVQLCWDVFFPEGFRVLALKGAEIVFAPTASAFFHSRKKWERAIQASAHANGIFIFRVNRVGTEEKQEFYGGSFCVSPNGEFVTGPSGSSEGVVLADIDLKEISTVRNEWVFLKDRRPGEYVEIAQEACQGALKT